MNRSSILTGGLLLAAAVVVPGLVNFLLTDVVSATLGTVEVGGTSILVTTGLIGHARRTDRPIGGVDSCGPQPIFCCGPERRQ